MKAEETQDILEKYLQQHIPISAAMGVSVKAASHEQIILSAPILNNINHKSTVFGGSLHAVATLACWSLLHVNIKDLFVESIQIVIAHSQVQYVAPVTTDFTAECCLPEKAAWERFLKILRKKGKARVKLTAQIVQNWQLCVAYAGDFVALKVD